MSFLVNPYVYGGCTDADANAFLSAAGITDPTITSAICTLVTSMKANGTWAKMNAIYPMVGGTATTHKFNLKNPLDTDAAYRLLFSGGWTHSANGALPNGSNAYADTFLPATSQSSLGYYSRTNNAGASVSEMGAISTNPQPERYFQIHARLIPNIWFVFPGAEVNAAVSPTTDSSGFYQGTRLTATSYRQIRNTTAIDVTGANYVVPSSNIYIGARSQNGNTPALYTNRECAFSYIGTSLTTTEASSLYTDVQAFQTTLSRQV
jgi:hypothetical protein